MSVTDCVFWDAPGDAGRVAIVDGVDRLTQQGREVYPILAAMAAWGERWLSGPEGTPLVLHHTTCDHDMDAVVVCSECAAPLDARETIAQ